MIFIDRSRASLDKRCARARFWGNEFHGRGVSPAGSAYPLIFGGLLHEALAHVNRGEAVPAALDLVHDDFLTRVAPAAREREWYVAEQWALLSGLVHGYALLVLPQLLEEHDIFSVEGECEMQLAEGVTLVATPDLILRRRSDQTLHYIEFKSTKMATGRWVNSWSRSVQAMAGALTMARDIGEDMVSYRIIGLYKGYEDKEGRTRSPFTYWCRDTKGVVSPQWKTGSQLQPIWEREGGVGEAVRALLSNDAPLLADQFPQTPPLFVNSRLVERWIAQLLRRERQIAATRGWHDDLELMDEVFPQNFDACEPPIGIACPFTALCFNPRGEEDPFTQGFQWRIPHHKGDPAFQAVEVVAEVDAVAAIRESLNAKSLLLERLERRDGTA